LEGAGPVAAAVFDAAVVTGTVAAADAGAGAGAVAVAVAVDFAEAPFFFGGMGFFF
jgi:hypothetical protein